jgi:hypothetical protein
MLAVICQFASVNFGVAFAFLNSSSKMFDIKPQCHLEVPFTISQCNAGFDSVTRHYLDDIWNIR